MSLKLLALAALLSPFAFVSSASHADPFRPPHSGPGLGPYIPDFGPDLDPPDVFFGETGNCEPIGNLPDFCIPDFGPDVKDPFEDVDSEKSIAVRYHVYNAASDEYEPLADYTLEVYAIKASTGEHFAGRSNGWIVLPEKGVYVFGANSANCSIPSKKVSVTKDTRHVELAAYCE